MFPWKIGVVFKLYFRQIKCYTFKAQHFNSSYGPDKLFWIQATGYFDFNSSYRPDKLFWIQAKGYFDFNSSYRPDKLFWIQATGYFDIFYIFVMFFTIPFDKQNESRFSRARYIYV